MRYDKFVQLKLHDLQWSSVVQPEWMGGNGKGHREVFSSKSSQLDYNSMVIGNLSASSLFGKYIYADDLQSRHRKCCTIRKPSFVILL